MTPNPSIERTMSETLPSSVQPVSKEITYSVDPAVRPQARF